MRSSSPRAVSMIRGTLRSAPHPAAHLKTAKLRQHEIQDDQIRSVAPGKSCSASSPSAAEMTLWPSRRR